MTMHLLPVYFTSTKFSRKGRKRKFTQKQQNAQREHEKFLKKMGVTGVESNKGIHDIPDYKENIRSTAKTSDSVPDNGSRKRAQQYTGTFIQGIATMHKSNAIPIINEEQAKDIARMRRG